MKMQLKVAAKDNKISFRGEGDLQLKVKATTLWLSSNYIWTQVASKLKKYG